MLNVLLNVLAGATTGDGLVALAAGIAVLGGMACAIGEGRIAEKQLKQLCEIQKRHKIFEELWFLVSP